MNFSLLGLLRHSTTKGPKAIQSKMEPKHSKPNHYFGKITPEESGIPEWINNGVQKIP